MMKEPPGANLTESGDPDRLESRMNVRWVHG